MVCYNLNILMNFKENIIKDLNKTQKESFEEKKEDLELVKGILEEQFGKDKLPKDLVLEMISIRKDIKNTIGKENFLDELDEATDNRIKSLMSEIYNPELKKEEIKEITEDKEGNIEILYKNGKKEILDRNEKELLFSLRLYFDSYRLAHNANKFRSNVEEIKNEIIQGNKDRKINFYEDKEKSDELISELKEKYSEAGFSEGEIKELIKLCDLKDLENLPIHEIKIMGEIKDLFSRFVGGDKTKYVGLSVALMVPAFIQGYAPMLIADAFKGSSIDIHQVFLFAAAALGGSSASFLIQKNYKDFINKNFQKEDGIIEYSAKNLTEMPADETKKFGLDTVKKRSERGRSSYEEVLNTISFDILPTATTLITSTLVLLEKSPILAGSTALASGITIVLNKYINKKGNFMGKQRDSERTSELMINKLNDQLNAHMEIVLAGEKERFLNEIQEFMEKEKIAQGNSRYFEILKNYWSSITSALNLTLGALAGALSGGSFDKVLAAILYSGNIDRGVQSLLNSKRNLIKSLRSVMQMELMFNGYAEEENGKENTRVSMSETKNSDINLKNVNVELDNKKILDNVNLDIPSGSMAYLEGASGAGKTTLMKIISGYYRPTSGEVKIGDVPVENIKKAGEESIYNRIAYLSQFPYLLDDSLKNNLKFGLNKEITEDKINEVLKDVGLYGRFAGNLDEKLFGGSGNSGKTSGGETSRIGLARILLKIRNSDSKIVFLDEPTASVDNATKKDIAQIINNEKEKRPEATFIVISHDEKFVDMLHCNIKVKMEKGKIVNE